MSVETNAVVMLPVDLVVCVCVNLCVCAWSYKPSVCVSMLCSMCVCLSFSGPLSAPSGPWRCGL